jgi:two-component system response regulator MprA
VRKVLVVEDDDDLRDVVTQTLQRKSFTVIGARDGAEALTTLERDSDVNLILLDLMMPRMHGWEFRRRQLADTRFAHIPVVVMTATTSLDEAAIDANDILRKPLSFSSLVETIERYMRKPPESTRQA